MKHKSETDALISELVDAHSARMNMREKYLLRESLYGLVRVARSELMMEIKTNALKLTGVVSLPRRRSTANGRAIPVQQKFEFNQFD